MNVRQRQRHSQGFLQLLPLLMEKGVSVRRCMVISALLFFPPPPPPSFHHSSIVPKIGGTHLQTLRMARTVLFFSIRAYF